MAWGYCVIKKKKFWEMFWVSFTCEEGGHFVSRSDLLFVPWFSPLTADTLFTFSRQNSNQRPRHLHGDWGAKHAQYASHLPPTTPRGGDGSTCLSEIPNTPLAFECCQNRHDKCGSAPPIRANWIFTKYCRRLKCVHDMLSKNENLN